MTAVDVKVATKVHSPSVPVSKGKTTRKMPAWVVDDHYAVLTEILLLHGDVTLAVDVFFVNKIIFLLTISLGIKFTIVEMLQDITSSTKV